MVLIRFDVKILLCFSCVTYVIRFLFFFLTNAFHTNRYSTVRSLVYWGNQHKSVTCDFVTVNLTRNRCLRDLRIVITDRITRPSFCAIPRSVQGKTWVGSRDIRLIKINTSWVPRCYLIILELGPRRYFILMLSWF